MDAPCGCARCPPRAGMKACPHEGPGSAFQASGVDPTPWTDCPSPSINSPARWWFRAGSPNRLCHLDGPCAPPLASCGFRGRQRGGPDAHAHRDPHHHRRDRRDRPAPQDRRGRSRRQAHRLLLVPAGSDRGLDPPRPRHDRAGHRHPGRLSALSDGLCGDPGDRFPARRGDRAALYDLLRHPALPALGAGDRYTRRNARLPTTLAQHLGYLGSSYRALGHLGSSAPPTELPRGALYSIGGPTRDLDRSERSRRKESSVRLVIRESSMRHLIVCAAGILAALTLGAPRSAATVYTVDPYGTGDFPSIQAAIDACVAGDVVELTDGEFTGDGNREIDFLGKAITLRSRSGNAAACVLDCQGSPQEPRRGLLLCSGEGPDTRIEEITIRDGFGMDPGGGIVCRGSAPAIVGCVLESCYADGDDWGGIYCENATPTIEHCTFRSCGGGLYCVATPATVRNCRFEGNGGCDSGALTAVSSAMTITDCFFHGNVG
ncbi:MAG: hypothetical protein GF330_07190 [Candidatus Eisenbacteria bacterium]|nr:hypothetical protein [Candidatus Eisenbacteria bacterium]